MNDYHILEGNGCELYLSCAIFIKLTANIHYIKQLSRRSLKSVLSWLHFDSHSHSLPPSLLQSHTGNTYLRFFTLSISSTSLPLQLQFSIFSFLHTVLFFLQSQESIASSSYLITRLISPLQYSSVIYILAPCLQFLHYPFIYVEATW